MEQAHTSSGAAKMAAEQKETFLSDIFPPLYLHSLIARPQVYYHSPYNIPPIYVELSVFLLSYVTSRANDNSKHRLPDEGRRRKKRKNFSDGDDDGWSTRARRKV